MKPQKIIVTGGAGFIGSHLVNKLIGIGHQVTVYDNLSTGKKQAVNPQAKLIKKDLSRPFKFIPADIVFHLAALPRIQRSFDQPLVTHQANVTATLNVLHAASQIKAQRVIFTSSSSVYGKIKPENLPVKETHPTCPLSPYAGQKLMSEIYCKILSPSLHLDTVILRLFNVFGPHMPLTGAYKLVIPVFLNQQKKQKPLTIFGDGRQTRDFTYISDTVSALISALDLKKRLSGEVINIGSGRETSILQVADLFGGKRTFVKNPREKWEEKYKVADIKKAAGLLNWKPKYQINAKLIQKII